MRENDPCTPCRYLLAMTVPHLSRPRCPSLLGEAHSACPLFRVSPANHSFHATVHGDEASFTQLSENQVQRDLPMLSSSRGTKPNRDVADSLSLLAANQRSGVILFFFFAAAP